MSVSVTKEQIKAEIDQMPVDKLDTLHRFIKELSSTREIPKMTGETFMEKMRKIKIDAPPDFSRNIDLYLNGEKTLD